MRLCLIATLVTFLACGGEEPAPEAESSPSPEASEIDPAPEASESAEAVAPEVSETATEEVSTEPVDLLQVLPRRMAASSFYRGDDSQIERLTDGDMETAWNSATMEAGATDPAWISVVVPTDVEVRSIAITAGYTKRNRGRDLFVQNLRVRHLVVRHGNEIFEFDLDVDERGLQELPVRGGGGLWRIEITSWEPGEREDYRELCVSELRLMGIPGTQTALPPVHDWEINDADRAEAAAFEAEERAEAEAEFAALEAEDDNALIEDDVPLDDTSPDGEAAAEDIVVASRPGVHLRELVLAPEIEGRTPLDPRSDYEKSADERVNCFFRLENPEREATEVSIAWEDSEGNSRNDPTLIPVPARLRFTHWRYTGTGWRRPGRYRCVLRDAEGEELGRASFDLRE